MKKILIFSFLSFFIMLFSLFYVDSIFLSDSSVKVVSTNEVNLKGKATILGYIPLNYLNFNFSQNYKKAVTIANNLMYLIDIDSESINILNTSVFVNSCSFLDDRYIIYSSKTSRNVNIYIYDLECKESYLLGNLSYKNFITLDNARLVNDELFFDIRYSDSNDVLSRSYVYKNNKFVRTASNDYFIINSINLNNHYIYTTSNTATYIDDSLFMYKNNAYYEYVGADKNSIVYLYNSKNNTLLSMLVSNDISIVEEYNIDSFENRRFFCSDNVYLVGNKFVLNLNEGVKINLENESNILYIDNNTILYELGGALYKKNY